MTDTANQPPETPSPDGDGDVTQTPAFKQAMEAVQGLGYGPTEMAEPEEDEAGDLIVFVRNGWIRITVAGELHKLRRPFVGELQDLETHLEADNERVHEINAEQKPHMEELRGRAYEIQTEAKDLPFDSIRRAELDEESAKLYAEVMRTQKALVREADKLRIAWWEHVIRVLTPPGTSGPEQLPSWIADPGLQARVVAHWRLVPLARGG